MNDAQTKNKIIAIIRNHVPQCNIYLFGSRARQTHKSGADFDIAIDSGHIINFRTILHIKNDLEDSNVPVFVDIVDLQAAPALLKKEIEKDKVLWASY